MISHPSTQLKETEKKIDEFKAEYAALAGVATASISVPGGQHSSSLVPSLWVEELIRRHL